MRRTTTLLLFVFGIALTISCGALRPPNMAAVDHLDRADEYNEKKEYDKAIAECDAAIRESRNAQSPDLAAIYHARGIAHKGKKSYDKAVADFEQALRLDAELAEAHNDLAWLLATCPQDNIRNGNKAVEHAKKAHEIDDGDPEFMATLGAAYAELGQFAEAIKWQRKALEDQGYRDDHGTVGEECVRHYQQRKPYRDVNP